MSELFVGVHPDDETLGCGGTILKRVAAGVPVHWLVVTEAFEPAWDAATIERKAREVERVAQAYGVARTIKLGLPTTRLDTVPEADLVTAFRDVVEELRPEVVYAPHPGDVRGDHRVVFHALAAALRAFRYSSLGLRRFLCFETLSSTDAGSALAGPTFSPTVVEDVSAHLERKLEVMALFESEAQPDPLPRGPAAIRALARVRGATVGVEYGEAFQLVRELRP